MSDNSVGKTPVSGALCQRDAELVRCDVMEGSPVSTATSNAGFANPLVSVRLCISFQNGNFGLIDKTLIGQDEMQDLLVASGEGTLTSMGSMTRQKAIPDPRSGQRHNRGRAIAPQVYRQAIARMAEVYRIVQTNRGVVIPEVICLFLSNTVLESLYLRGDEWRQACNADPMIDADAKRIGRQIHDSLVDVLSNAEAEPWTPNGVQQLTFIGVLRRIQEDWCEIFPFCGRKPSPPSHALG